jgi:hypothetical protein
MPVSMTDQEVRCLMKDNPHNGNKIPSRSIGPCAQDEPYFKRRTCNDVSRYLQDQLWQTLSSTEYV